MENTTTTVGKRNVKINGYSNVKRKAKLKVRQEEADERMAKHDSLSVDARLAKAQSRRGKSFKEVTRLEQSIKQKQKSIA